MATVVTWLGCDLVSGKIIEELPDLTPEGKLQSLLGAYTSAAFSLPISLGGQGKPPREWEAATEEGRTMIVSVLGGQPIWAGIILKRVRGSTATVKLGCVTLEGYLNRRYVGNHSWVQQDESSVIAAGLIADAQTEGISFVIDAPATGTLRDREYKDQDDKTVYSALRELMGVTDGPEWTVALGWTDSTQTAVGKTIRVRKRIGVVSSAPNAIFATGSASAVVSSAGTSEATYELDIDYSDGKGSNHIIATSSGEGDARPQSAPARDTAKLAAGWPRWEYRYSPASSISAVATLDGHAQRALDIMGGGAKTIKITARADVYPVLGTDWTVGDDIGFDLVGHAHPDGLTGVARAIGWELDARRGTVSPILFTPDLEA